MGRGVYLGFVPVEKKFEVKEAAPTLGLEVVLVSDGTAPIPVAGPEDRTPPPRKTPGWAWAMGAVGIVGLGVGVGFGVAYAGVKSKVASDCPNNACPPPGFPASTCSSTPRASMTPTSPTTWPASAAAAWPRCPPPGFTAANALKGQWNTDLGVMGAGLGIGVVGIVVGIAGIAGGGKPKDPPKTGQTGQLTSLPSLTSIAPWIGPGAGGLGATGSF